MIKKSISVLSAILTITLIGSQLLCGFWMAAKGSTNEGKAFHRKLGIGTSIAAFITAGLMIFIAVI